MDFKEKKAGLQNWSSAVYEHKPTWNGVGHETSRDISLNRRNVQITKATTSSNAPISLTQTPSAFEGCM